MIYIQIIAIAVLLIFAVGYVTKMVKESFSTSKNKKGKCDKCK